MLLFSIKSDLGTSPISSVPYVVSLMSALGVGTATILINAVLLSLVFLAGLYDVREETAAAAVCVGFGARSVNRLIRPLERQLTG